jgi:16S rRNA C1402 N4-methylase RsmH
MAIDPKTGETTPDGTLGGGGWVDELIRRLASDDIVDEDGRPVPPPAVPKE